MRRTLWAALVGYALLAAAGLVLAQSASVVGPSGRGERGPGRGGGPQVRPPSAGPMPPSTPAVQAPLPPYAPTILAFDVTDPTGAKPNLNVSLYEAPVNAGWAADFDTGVAFTYWYGLQAAYDEVALASGVGSFEGLPAGDYWYVIWGFAGYGYHGGVTTPALVSVVGGATTTVTVAQADAKWTDGAKSSYIPVCTFGLTVDLGAGGSTTLFPVDALAVAPPADTAFQIQLVGDLWAESLPLDCSSFAGSPLTINVATWSENRIYGDFCSTDLTVTDSFDFCGGG